MITRIVKLTFQKEKVDDFKEIWENSKDKIASVDGCRFVEMFQAREPSNICFTHSIWESENDLNAYRHSDLFAVTWAKTKVLFSEKPEAWSLDSHGTGKSQ